MEILKYPSDEAVADAIRSSEPLLVLVAFDASHAIAAPIDEAMEHYILLKKAGHKESEIDQYFRIVLDHDGADWTFVCPTGYKNITDKSRRIATFYKDGFAIIPQVIHALGFIVGIEIPKRYRRHFDIMSEQP